jgi:predicted RNA binding protein YcfA (HicA-like mRNA interferase family)
LVLAEEAEMRKQLADPDLGGQFAQFNENGQHFLSRRRDQGKRYPNVDAVSQDAHGWASDLAFAASRRYGLIVGRIGQAARSIWCLMSQGRVVSMPRKVRELVRDLDQAGFTNRGGKGSHRNFVHPRVAKPITISGKDGDDAKPFQEKAVNRAIRESRT